MIWKDFERFYLLVRQCLCAKPPQHTLWPVFDVTVKLEQDTVGGSEPDKDRIRCVLVSLFTLELVLELTILGNVDLQHTTVNVDLKLRFAEENTGWHPE